MAYDPNVHHRRSIRCRIHDYSDFGLYFITVCVQGRELLFGEIVDGAMRPNQLGSAVEGVWRDLVVKYPSLELDEFVVMPNHFHALVGIGPAGNGQTTPTLGNVMGFFKYTTTVKVNGLRGVAGVKLWQRDYFDHVVRTNEALSAIREYIHMNPVRRQEDMENPSGMRKDDVQAWVRQWDVPVARGKGGETPPLQH